MSVFVLVELRGNTQRSVGRVFYAATVTEPALASKGYVFDVVALWADIHGIAFAGVLTVDDFLYFFIYGLPNGFSAHSHCSRKFIP